MHAEFQRAYQRQHACKHFCALARCPSSIHTRVVRVSWPATSISIISPPQLGSPFERPLHMIACEAEGGSGGESEAIIDFTTPTHPHPSLFRPSSSSSFFEPTITARLAHSYSRSSTRSGKENEAHTTPGHLKKRAPTHSNQGPRN